MAARRDDKPLIADLLAGDHQAIGRVQQWIRGALSVYRRRLGSDVEDVEQECLLTLVEHLRGGRFRGDSSLATYARSLVHHKCIDRLRARARREWVDVEDLELESSAPSAFERMARTQSAAQAMHVLAEMPEECRAMWAMIHRGASYREMSEHFGVAEGTLRVRVLRCRKKAQAVRQRLLDDPPAESSN